MTNKIEYGQVNNFNPTNVGSFSFTDADTTDTRYYNTTYAAISGNSYIVDHPATAILADGNNNTVQETDFSYNSSSGTLAAKLTRISSGYYATNSYGSYTSYGLVGSTTDPVGVQTTITYDSTYNTYPATTTVGSFTTTTSYDARSGQLAVSTDISGVTVSNSFDAFNRPTEIDKIPIGGGSAVWMKKISYPAVLKPIASGLATNYVDVLVNDGVGGVESRTYVDGFERPVQTRTQGENGNYRVVSTAYDGRGNAFLTTWPSFGTSITFSKPTSQTATWTGYDAAGRVATNRLVRPRSIPMARSAAKPTSRATRVRPLAAKTWSYVNGTDPWWIIFTDEDGQVRRYGLDAFGRTNQIQEVDGSSTYTTTLKYDLANNLTNLVNANAREHLLGLQRRGRRGGDGRSVSWPVDVSAGLRGPVARANRRAGRCHSNSYVNPSTGPARPVGPPAEQDCLQHQLHQPHARSAFTITYFYDSSDDGNYTVYPGLLYKMIDSQGWEKNGYDARARTIKTSRYLNINSNTYTTSYTLDDGDNVTAIGYPNSGPTITYSYFHGGSINQVSCAGGSYNYYTVTAAALR